MRTLTKKQYPPLLREINDPPAQLHIEGSLAPKGHTYLTIVGSRHYSDYGKDALNDLVAGLSGYPISIVSGLALGIDRLSHEAALSYGLHTIAIPGSGLDRSVLYPARHRDLAQRILKAGGALISEFKPHEPANNWTFPQRNRIMAGISPATLIIEATERSGTLITARLAADYNRDVLVLPGSIFARNTIGPHMLLRLGATPVTKSEHILESLNIEAPTLVKRSTELTQEEQVVINLLKEPLPRETLMQALDMDTKEANILLSMMELREHISEQAGVIRAKI